MRYGIAKIAVLLAISTQAHSQAPSQTFTFCQEGYSEGAVVSGSFTGADDNLDGQLESNELTDITVNYSGNSLVGPLSFDLSNLFGFVYDLDGGPLGDGLTGGVEGIAAGSGAESYAAGPGPAQQCGIGIDCAAVGDGTGTDSSQELISINPTSCGAPATPATPVPALPLFGLLALGGLLGLFGLRKLKQ